jgi:raffinose/stachyose/melibiose transport system substrate-binding protein
MKKRVLSLLLAAGMMISIAACGASKSADTSNSSVATDSQAVSTESTASTDGTQKAKFTLWHSYVGSDQRAPFMEEIMTQFRAKYTNYEIDEQKIPRDQYQTKLKTQAAAGQLPDAFVMWPNAMTKEFSKAGLLSDINDLLSREKEWKDGFIDRALQEFTVDGKTYSAGLGVSVTSIVYYNKALFDKYGLTYPKTYTEMKNVIKTFKDNGVIPIALGNKPKWPVQSTVISCLANRYTGSEWLDKVLAKDGAKFTDPEFVSSLTALKEITDMQAFNKDFSSIDNVQARDYFYRGDAAMMIEGSWAVADMVTKLSAEMKPNIELGVLPAFEGGKGDANVMSGVSATGIAINAKVSPEQKAAIENLIMFATNSDAQKLYAKSNIPVSYKNVDIDASTVDPIYVKLTKLISEHPLVTVYDSALNSEQADIVNNGLQAIMSNQKTPAQIAEQLQAAVK